MAKTAIVGAKTPSVSNSKEDKKIKKLEKLLALYIQRAADSLKENQALSKELEQAEKKINNLRRHYEKSRKEKKIRCDRSKAMVQYGDVDLSEVTGIYK